MKYILFFLLSVFISSVSQTILKKSANEEHNNVLQEYVNFKVILSYGLFFGASLMTVLAYRYVPLSMGPILESSGYIFVAILGYFFLQEQIGKRKLLGLGCILIGILLFGI